ncbi:MAG: peptidase M61, partial [Lysobacterales bacterium 13-68-4]
MRLSPRLSLLSSALMLAVAVPVIHAAELPAPVDQPYPGTLTLAVDLTGAPKKIFRIAETIPVTPGPLTLYYPKWIPGEHAPSGPIQNVTGLVIRANGKQLAWRRDLREMYAVHLDVPQGVSQLDLSFQFLSPGEGGEFGASASSTPNLVDIEFNQTAFYPAGHFTRQITIAPSVTLPAGWKFGTALEVASQSGNTTQFKPVTFNNLVDSPLIAGRHFNRVDLDPGAKVPVHLNVVGDGAADVKLTDKQLAGQRAVVQQTLELFGAHHYGHYDFLLTLSDHTGHFGLEHHQSSDDRLPANFFTDDTMHKLAASLMPHEFVHSWNGKFRRPADLWTPTFMEPMQDDLLWVYEGQTQYWGFVLTARAGMWTPEQFRDALAMVAANYDRNREGFQWRTLEDTTNDPTAARRASLPYRSWQMSEEYYSAGQMVWLAVDAKLRALTHDHKSLDDFAKAFFGVDNGSYVTKTYTFDDVVAALDGVAKYDWASFLRQHVDTVNPPLLDGLEGTGWK